MLAFVPLSIASIRWLIGWPISTFAPTIVPNFSRTSATNSLRERSFNSNGASISETFTPSACSSSSARPVLRATVCISGMLSSNSSARCPILSLSSNEMPGKEDMLIVNEPSLKGGRNERPNVKKHTRATTNKPIVLPSTIFLCPSTNANAAPYHCFILRATNESLLSFCSFFLSLPKR